MHWTFAPPGHHFRDVSLGSIAVYLHARFTQLGMLPDLDEALSLARNALELRPPGHHDRSISLSSVANHLRPRFNCCGILSDL